MTCISVCTFIHSIILDMYIPANHTVEECSAVLRLPHRALLSHRFCAAGNLLLCRFAGVCCASELVLVGVPVIGLCLLLFVCCLSVVRGVCVSMCACCD